MPLTVVTARHELDANAYAYAAEHGLVLPGRHAPSSDLLHLDPSCRHTEPRPVDRRKQGASAQAGVDSLECASCIEPAPAGTTVNWDKIMRAVSEVEQTDRAAARADAFTPTISPARGTDVARVTARTLSRWPNHTAALPQRDLPAASVEMRAALVWIRQRATRLDEHFFQASAQQRWTPVIAAAWGVGDDTSPVLVMVDRPRAADPQAVLMQKMLRPLAGPLATPGAPLLATGPHNLVQGITGVTDTRIAVLDDRPLEEQLPAPLIDHLLHTWDPGVSLQDLLTGLRAAAL